MPGKSYDSAYSATFRCSGIGGPSGKLEDRLATGTSSGLLDSNDHAQSAFKHAILKNYLPPFLTMTAKTAPGRRAVVMDGFAGRGRFEDGSPGSAELIMQAAEELRRIRSVATFFTEKDRASFRSLKAVVGEYADRGLLTQAFHGSAEDHLSRVVDAACGVPLFLFLDPCGAMLPFAHIEEVLKVQRPHPKPQTEVLLNFSAEFTRRTTGQLAKGQVDAPGVRRMDITCGTEKWRKVALEAYQASPDGTFGQVADVIAERYARRLANATGMSYVTVPVRRRLQHLPVYHLVFLTRSSYGVWVFADALGRARKEWLKTVGRLDDSGPLIALPGFSKSDDMLQRIDGDRSRAQEIVEACLRDLMRPRPRPLKLVKYPWQVFGSAYGIATDETVAVAVGALEQRGEITVWRPSGRVRDWRIGPA